MDDSHDGGMLLRRHEGEITTHFKHDDRGLLNQQRTERDGFTPVETRYAHDMLGRLTAVHNRHSEVKRHYDAADNLIAEEQTADLPDGQFYRSVYRHTYDVLGNRLTTTLPSGREVAWLRYGSGHVHAMALDQETLLDFERDALHRETARHTHTQSYTRQYDAMGRLTRQQRTLNNILQQQRLYHYSATSELAGIDDSLKGPTRYAYDPLGRLRQATNPLGEERFAFDPAGNMIDPEWLSKAQEQKTQQRAEARSATRDGQPINTRWNATTDASEFDYAGMPRIMGNLLQYYVGTHYQHDSRGNRTRETEPSGRTTEYSYNAEDQLIEVKRYRRAPAAGDTTPPEMQAKYGYDGFGRRQWKLVKEGKHTPTLTVFSWDGDLLTSEEAFEGRFSFITHYGYPPAPELTREYPEEPFSLPIAQRIHTINATPLQSTHWLYEAESFVPAVQLVEQYEQAQHTHALHTGTGPAFLSTADPARSEPQRYMIHTDHLGTPQELTDSEGQLHWVGQYRAWGELQKATNGRNDSPDITMTLRFQGQYHDEETGLHYNRFRYYDPRIGRFTTQDPISLAGGINLYQYAPNPTGWIDPYGLSECSGDGELYRGVSAKHPELENASKGIVKPANPHANLTPEQHAEGGLTGESQFVSWTPNKELALSHANKDGPGGVLLSVPAGAPPKGVSWSWGWSHINDWGEVEMLQSGTRKGVNVTSL